MKIRLYLSILAMIFLMGCGYKMGSLTPRGIRSVSVPVFENTTLFRDFEFFLTQAVANEILLKTSLYVTPKNADTILKGKIIEIEQLTIAKNQNRQVEIQVVTVTVQVEWIDNRTGKIILPIHELSQSVEIIAGRGENFGNASIEAFGDMARIIVQRMEDPRLVGE